jgi:hypothetical protein
VIVAMLLTGCVHHENRRLQGNTALTLAMLHNLFDGLARYAEVCGGYPATLEPLERPGAGSAPSCARLGTFADAVRAEGVFKEGDKYGSFERSLNDLAQVRERGIYREYRFQYVPRDAQADGRFRGYELSADPVERGVTGHTSFWLSELGEIRQNRQGGAGRQDSVYRVVARRRATPSPT